MKLVYRVCFLWVLCCVLVCLTSGTSHAQRRYKDKGGASYYADKFNGRKTASGEIFDNAAMTAAHRTLPFGTYVKVTNLANGKSVIVRINDRGPYAHGRIIDVTKAAAIQLGMVGTGTAWVMVEEVDAPDPPTGEVPEASEMPGADSNQLAGKFQTGHTYSMWGTERFPKGIGLQVGSYRDAENAIDQCRTLIKQGGLEEVYIQVGWSGGRIYRVIVGAYPTREEALLLLPRIRALGMDGFPKRHFD
ncbi:rare lipoprotein A [Thermonema lapsum]|uniref:Probable endolytic peptidoglycan transglycosylase RlpA n=1 Tax=Thermonema lapsum TaxID=28195 RepID=A0A846MPB7_9BACT|nr:septal ring lytic transglycosylase RlpA family protein [Thermonema lapsum]NIK73305.1 rare lipoprotein A [Thermonema lapsum]